MIDNNSIETLQEEYLYRYYGYTIAELEQLKIDFIIELQNIDEYTKKFILKDIDHSCLIIQPDIDVLDIIEARLRFTELELNFPEYRFYKKIEDLLYIKISSRSFIYTVNKNSGDIVNEAKGYNYSKLRKLWANYLSLSQELILAIFNFTDCLYKNRLTFTEGKVKDYIEQYGPK